MSHQASNSNANRAWRVISVGGFTDELINLCLARWILESRFSVVRTDSHLSDLAMLKQINWKTYRLHPSLSRVSLVRRQQLKMAVL